LSLAQNVKAMEEIKRLISTQKWLFIAVLHPKIDAKIVKEFKAMQNAYFTFYDTTDLVPLYTKADVMLSDTTSAITEFILQKKPVVTLNNNQPLPHLINITDIKKIEESLEYALSKPNEIMKNIDDFILHTHPFDDGKSSKRVIDACLDFLEKDTIRRKPLNLIRRYKIRKKLHYFKLF
jgi:CDP-glycerol glycerophosphotransferase (TagB/SpsB family)